MKKEIFTIRKKIQPYKNLLPPFSEWVLHANAKVNAPYELELVATAADQFSSFNVPVKENQEYTLSLTHNGIFSIFGSTTSTFIVANSTAQSITFNTGNNKTLGISVRNLAAGTFSFKNPILSLGSVSHSEFVPQEESVIRERLKDNGQVQEVRVRFYPGVERTLQVSPYVLHKNNRREDFFTYPEGTEPYITGDNDYLIFPCSLDFQYDDEICIEYNHAGGDFPYTLAVDVVVTYHEAEVIA
jgi:hypothetical protein